MLTQFLLRRVERRCGAPAEPAVRTAYANLAGAVGLGCNLLLCVGKLAVGLAFGSISVLADALNNLSDASSNVVSLVGFRLAAKAPDEKHPYGHARYEYLAGLAVSVTILGIGFSLLREALGNVLHPTPVAFSWLSVAVLAASMAAKLWLSRFNGAVGRLISSDTLLAASADSRNDVLSTGAVLAAAILCHYTGLDIIDGLMGAAVSVFILVSGWGLVRSTLSPLLGESPSPELVRHIEQTVLAYPGVLGMHDLMVHDYGPGHRFASLHVEVPAETDQLAAHDLVDGIERDFLQNDRLLVTIHADPIVTQDALVGVLRARIAAKVRDMDPALSIHDLRLVPDCKTARTNVLFELEAPAGYTGSRMRLLEAVRRFVAEEGDGYCAIVAIKQSFTGAETQMQAKDKNNR